MPTPRRILVVSYYFPPSPLPGAHRWESMAHALRGLGHEVTVITTGAAGTLSSDEPWVIRTGDLQTSPTLRRLLRRPETIAAGEGDAAPDVTDTQPEPSRIFTRGLVPDAWVVSWLPYVVRAARRIVRERAIEVVITNGPPDSTHLLGLALGRDRPAWVADFDDGWRYEALMGNWPTRAQDRLDASMERRVVRGAEAVVGITDPIARDFERRYGCRAYEVPSGWDPAALDAEIARAEPPKLNPDVVNLVHTGSLSLPLRRDPRTIFAALELFAARDPAAARRLRLVHAGMLSAEDRRMLAALTPAARASVEVLGYLPRRQALALQRAGDALLLFSTGAHAQVVTAKLSEYLLAQRPILAVLSANEAARIIRDTQAGTVTAPEDVEGIADALASCVDGRLAAACSPHGIERYVQPSPAREFEAVLEQAIEARTRRPARARRRRRRRP
jgi:glycosyltransferase involved in cell wall biosynthesis